MSEILWWAKENWYEAKTIPVFSFMVSPRQVIFVLGFGILGLIISAFIPIYYVKIAVMFFMVIVGAVLASLPAKVVPFELALLYRYAPSEKPPARPPVKRAAGEEIGEEVQLGTGVPFAVTGELKVEKQTEVVLYVDGAETARDIVSPTKPRYRLYYYPEAKGAHELLIMVNGEVLKKVMVNVN